MQRRYSNKDSYHSSYNNLMIATATLPPSIVLYNNDEGAGAFMEETEINNACMHVPSSI
jgi:hypothetical protein